MIVELRTRANHQRERAIGLEHRYLIKATKIVSFEVGSVAFSILAGLVGLANNNHVTNLIEINGVDAAILFGIGLGIGSLKGLVDH